MQTCKPFVGTLCSLTRPFVAVFVLQLIALRWGMGVPLTPTLYLQSLAIALGIVGIIGALLYRVNCRAYDAAKLQHTRNCCACRKPSSPRPPPCSSPTPSSASCM
jgi:hypothetical protein